MSGYTNQNYRIDGSTFLHVVDVEAALSCSLNLDQADLVCIQVTLLGEYSRSMGDHIDIINPAVIDISNFSRSRLEVKEGEKLRGILIAVQREYLIKRYQLQVDSIPGEFKSIFVARAGMPRALRLVALATIRRLAEEIISTSLPGPLKGVYVRAKAVEIICALVQELNSRGPHVLRVSATQQKIQLIKAAAAIYQRELHNPPSMDQLSARVGLNRNDLVSGFRELFGTTPYSYCRKVRMEEARILLKNSRLSISEIARRVGYDGYASFSRAYREHFGCPPATDKVCTA